MRENSRTQHPEYRQISGNLEITSLSTCSANPWSTCDLKKMFENRQPVEVKSNSPSAANHEKMAHLYLILWCQNIMPVGSGQKLTLFPWKKINKNYQEDCMVLCPGLITIDVSLCTYLCREIFPTDVTIFWSLLMCSLHLNISILTF